MNFHKVLQDQIQKHLTVDYAENPLLKDFFHSLNNSYLYYERHQDSLENTFRKTKMEYYEVNQQLKKEIEFKKLAANNLYEIINKDDLDYEIDYEHNDDLLFVSEYLKAQISKRKETETQLSHTVELLKTLLANLQSGILVEDKNQKTLFTNQLLCDVFSIKSSPEDMLGIDSANLIEQSKKIFKEDSNFVQRLNVLSSKKEIVTCELLETIDNRFFERDYIPIFIGDEFRGHLWKYSDVTERKQSQKLLEESEERTQIIMNSALNAIITVDNRGKITFWNNQAEIMFGWTKGEVLNKKFTKFTFSHSSKAIWEDSVYKFLVKGDNDFFNKQVELTLVNKAGHEFLAEITITPILQNGKAFFCAFIQDISEKREAENIRKIQEEKYKNVIAYMNLGLLEVDNNGVIQYANQSFATISGYEISELKGKKSSDFFVFGDNFNAVKSKNELTEQGISDIYQLCITNKRGQLRWWAISGATNYDAKGNKIGVIGIYLDITEQKKLELELEKEKTKALESSVAKEAFLANMSHEIRTPLNAIIGFLRELDKQKLSGIQKKFVDNSSIASKHLLAIINNVLDISKIEAGEMSIEFEDFILEKSISNLTSVLQPLINQKGLIFDVYISNEIQKVLKGDSLRLQQILFNLVGNAIKFTNKGSISIKCIVLADFLDSQNIKISISDTGIGMQSEYIENIFNKFSQEDKTITRKYGGTGLGLTITRELIKLMNGRIEIESEKNIGTTFHIYFNYPKGNEQFLENMDIEKPIVNLDNISILLVEDNYLNRMVAQNSLQYFNCKVTEVRDGLEAIAILKNTKFDIILMDIQMPEMGGIEATEIIRKKLNITTPIIALTANAFKTEIIKCKKAGMNDYVTKPFDENLLINTIAKYTTSKKKATSGSELLEEFSSNKLYDLTSLHNLSRGNKEFVAKMIGIFVEQTKYTIEKITASILLNDFIEVSRLIHKIKPSIENLGIKTIIKEIKLLEKIANVTTDKQKISALFNTIKEVLDKVVIQLSETQTKDGLC